MCEGKMVKSYVYQVISCPLKFVHYMSVHV